MAMGAGWRDVGCRLGGGYGGYPLVQGARSKRPLGAHGCPKDAITGVQGSHYARDGLPMAKRSNDIIVTPPRPACPLRTGWSTFWKAGPMPNASKPSRRGVKNGSNRDNRKAAPKT